MVRQALAEHALQSYTDTLLQQRQTTEVRRVGMILLPYCWHAFIASPESDAGRPHRRAFLGDTRFHLLRCQDTSPGAHNGALFDLPTPMSDRPSEEHHPAHLIRPRTQDGVEAAQSGPAGASGDGKKPSKSQRADGADVALDTDWVSAHASQVAKMLPGGELIMGCTRSAS